eukprot:gene3418-gene1857
MMVSRRWAIVRTVQSRNASATVCWMRASVSTSTDAVTSSIRSSLLSRRRALARHTSWRCPTEKFCPPSMTETSSLSSVCSNTSLKCACSSALQIALSGWAASGSRLERTVPLKRTGSCGMMLTRLGVATRSRREMTKGVVRSHPTELPGAARSCQER